MNITREEVQQVLDAMKFTPLDDEWFLARNMLQSKLAEQCHCDRNNLGVPGVSCGDCPTRDYKTEKDDVEPVAYLWQHGETGRTRIVMHNDVFTDDGRWFKVGPMYLGGKK